MSSIEQVKYVVQIKSMKAFMAYANQVLPPPTDLIFHPFQPGDWVYVKTWKTGSP